MNSQLITGLLNPVHDAQAIFRQTLSAMSEPGLWQSLPSDTTLCDFYSSTTALLLAFLDADTTLWLPEKWQQATVIQNLTFHCGCQLTSEQHQAQFAVLDWDSFMNLSSLDFAMGSDRYPDQSTTIILQLPQNGERHGSVWSGPGIETSRECILPITSKFWGKRQSLMAFPQGVDFLLTYQDSVMGLPRTTQVLQQEDALCM